MCDNWPGINGIDGFDPLQEGQEWRWMNWHSVIGPSCKLAVLNIPGQFIPASGVFQPQGPETIVRQFGGFQQCDLKFIQILHHHLLVSITL